MPDKVVVNSIPLVKAALEKGHDIVLSGVLANSLTLCGEATGEAVKEWDINGESAVIGVKRS